MLVVIPAWAKCLQETFIVSGGDIEFMRAWAEQVYGIPPDQIIGNFIDDKVGKPVGINQHIGRRPIAAFGNSDGDFQVLEWTTSGNGPRFGLIVHHTDAEREFAYDRESHFGKLDKAWVEASAKGQS